VHVKKWIDYTTKYGVGYLLSNGNTGVYFNDGSKIIYCPAYDHFEYIERKERDNLDLIVCYTLSSYPRVLHKKVVLLQHFRENLELAKAKRVLSWSEKPEPIRHAGAQRLVHLKKWVKTKHSILFKLSNKNVQVDFQDKTQVILSNEKKIVNYVDKQGDPS
jgi:polo-like kinase 1